MRIPEADLAEIDRRAAARRLNRSAYMIGCSLGRDYAPALLGEEVRERLEDIEDRLGRIDRASRRYTFGIAARLPAWQ